MAKNERFIVNRGILPKGKINGVDWFNTKEIEVYFTDDDKSYILKVDDIIKENGITKILLSYDNIKYKKYLQGGQILNGNLEHIFSYFNIRGNKLRPYKISEDGLYWIGITDKGKEFYFNGENSEEIMKHNWYVNNGYLVSIFRNYNNLFTNIRLNRFVLGVTDREIMVNHKGGNKMDNRVEMLSISDHEDNAKEHLPSKFNNTGVTGLTKTKDNTYRIQCAVNGFSYFNQYKTKDEALKNLLIIQRYYGYRHNEKLYYMLDDVSDEYINELIRKVSESVNNRKVNPIICKNRFELSEDGSFYYMYDKKNNRCKISVEDLELVKQGNWRYTLNTDGKEYFGGEIVHTGKRKGIFLHRFLMDLIDIEYKQWHIDHLDGDGLNNTRDNIVITDSQGNGLNKKRKGYCLKNGKYRISLVLFGVSFYKTVETEQEAIEIVKQKREEAMKKRLEFYSRGELDTYLK